MLGHYILFFLSIGVLIYNSANTHNWLPVIVAFFFYFLGWHRGYLRYVKFDDYTAWDAVRDIKRDVDRWKGRK